MIFNIRGTSGSGKTTLVQELKKLYLYTKPHYVSEAKHPDVSTWAEIFPHLAKRKRPLFLELQHPRGENNLFVIGHYDKACGGCDTIGKKQFDTVYHLVRRLSLQGDVLFEGLLISAEIVRAAQLPKDETQFIMLTTPLEECIAGIQARRDARGDTREVNPRNTISKHRAMPNVARRLSLEEGMTVLHLSREDALEHLRNQLGV